VAGLADTFPESLPAFQCLFHDATFSVEIKLPWGETIEDIEVKIDYGGMIHGDADTIDVLIAMLEKAKEDELCDVATS
jgi:hypothetical protein